MFAELWADGSTMKKKVELPVDVGLGAIIDSDDEVYVRKAPDSCEFRKVNALRLRLVESEPKKGKKQ